MSDEIHLQAAMRHAEEAVCLPWQAMAPDEEMMRAEEGEGEDGRRYAWLYEELMSYLFGDKDPERWENVAMRAMAVFWHCLAGELVGRDMTELNVVKGRAVILRSFNLEKFVRMAEVEEFREMLRKMMIYLFPAKKEWMRKGCQRAYLLARAYQPALVATMKKVDGHRKAVDLNYEDMARIFEGDELLTEESRGNARARWSARAQVLLRHPVEQAGGTAHIQFGKSATAREKMARSARGNMNRQGAKAAKGRDDFETRRRGDAEGREGSAA